MASHLLTADGGCYVWTSRRPDVVSVVALGLLRLHGEAADLPAIRRVEWGAADRSIADAAAIPKTSAAAAINGFVKLVNLLMKLSWVFAVYT